MVLNFERVAPNMMQNTVAHSYMYLIPERMVVMTRMIHTAKLVMFACLDMIALCKMI